VDKKARLDLEAMWQSLFIMNTPESCKLLNHGVVELMGLFHLVKLDKFVRRVRSIDTAWTKDD
jgi:hypothetical protein